jgi:hypothetical protein
MRKLPLNRTWKTINIRVNICTLGKARSKGGPNVVAVNYTAWISKFSVDVSSSSTKLLKHAVVGFSAASSETAQSNTRTEGLAWMMKAVILASAAALSRTVSHVSCQSA